MTTCVHTWSQQMGQHGNSALLLASANGHENMVKVLIEPALAAGAFDARNEVNGRLLLATWTGSVLHMTC